MIRNLRYNHRGTIDLEYDHPVYGWIPFTASLVDVEPLGVELYNLALSGEYGTISPYVPPTSEASLQAARESAVLTRREFFLAIDAAGMYDAVMAMKDDPLTPRATVIELDTATEFKRTWPTLMSAAQQLGVTEEQLDQVFGII